MSDRMIVDGICRRCGAHLFADSLQGRCPACLLQSGLDLLDGEEEETTDSGSWEGESETKRLATIIGEFGDYELLREIGRGGQGVVYRARQKSLNRTVALKLIGLGHWATEAHLRRFRHEAKAAASLDHPGIVPIYEVGEYDGSCYFSMRLIEGAQLDLVARGRPMPTRRAADLVAKVARSVQYAHERGILHRDIKPGNILLDRNGEPHLTDFGLARILESEERVTRTTEALGTPSYMAPEQAAGKTSHISRATDIYALGAVLYQLLAGHPPFVGATAYETVRLLLETEPRPPRLWNPKVDCDLATICLKCLRKDPLERYSSARALAEDLERWQRHEPIRARPSSLFVRTKKWLWRKPMTAGLVVSLLALGAAVGTIFWIREGARHPMMPASIAVLPFENLNTKETNDYFVDGVQDDILTKLAKIAGLKVISRTSVMQYRHARSTRVIGQALQVSYVLEGSVRREHGRIHLNAQLIDTRTDTHIWAEEYDRDLAQMFAIQSEIAARVAAQLQVKMSPAERQAVLRPPTADLTAFDLYTRAENLIFTANLNSSGKANLLGAVDLLQQAVRHDPSFFQAYCELAYTHGSLYFFGFDHSPARLRLAEAATGAALRLRPDAGEAHLTLAGNLYRGHLDFEGALAELRIARRTLPNDPRVFALEGYIERRRGRPQAALRSLERAAELDPRNSFTLNQLATSYADLRRYPEASVTLNRALAVAPDDIDTKIARALLEFDWKAEVRPLHQLLERTRAESSAALQRVSESWLTCALAERDATAAEQALQGLRGSSFGNDALRFSRAFGEGLVARMRHDAAAARSAFLSARAEQEKAVQAQPNYGPPLGVLGLIDAALGRKEEALREGRRALALLPIEKDALNGAHMRECLAMIAAWVGDNDLACAQLAVAIRPPSVLSYGQLKLLPMWDPLRGDPRFERILATLAPKSL